MSNNNNSGIFDANTGISRRSVLQTIGGLGAAGLAGVGSASTDGMGQLQTQGASLSENPAILVFSATEGWDHVSIPTANQTIKELATEIGNENNTNITVDVITGPAETGESNFPTSVDELSQYDVVVWASTTGDILNAQQQAAFEQYIQNGGAYMGIHAAADTEYNWNFYGDLVGAYFESHPAQQTATVNIEDQNHPATDHLPATWERYDEWYNYRENPRSDVNVLATLDESTYNEGDNTPNQTDDHPIAWYHNYEGARSFYTGMGHTTESYSNEEFRKHLKGGLMWAAGYVNAWIQLFNGENLDDWTPKFSGYNAGENYKNTFTVENDLLTINYNQYDTWNGTFGHLFYNQQEFSHYILRAEYRFVGNQVSGGPSWASRNNGLMIHGETAEQMAIDQNFPNSIEVQLLGAAAGSDIKRPTANVCTPGTDIFMDGSLYEQHCTRSSSDTYRGDEWVTVTIVVRGNQEIRHYVENDGVVMSYTNPQLDAEAATTHGLESNVPISQGTVSIQSESHPTQFRSIELKPIDPDAPIGSVSPGKPDPAWESYTKTELASSLKEPMAIEVAPDGRVFYTTRGVDGTGLVGVIDPETTEITTALEIEIYLSGEDGLQGIVLDPDFEQNDWVYLYYSVPHSEAGENLYDRVSRFTVTGNTIDPASETVIITIPNGPNPCCHVGGDLEFGPEGNLYISSGDDTSPFQSSGYTPIDERDGRELFDAQRSAGNTNDLRGSILRITPQDDGSYTVPEGNLFTGPEYADARKNDKVKTEIYVMGCRNPFRMGIDPATGVLYWGDYGPDARSWNAKRGPPGCVEFNRASEPGYYGWPYVVGSNIPYIDGQFVDANNDRGYKFISSGEPFDPQNLTNDSPNNDGLTQLPVPKEPAIWYTYSWDALLNSPPEYAQEYVPEEPPFPNLEGGAPMGGPIFQSEKYSGDQELPQYLDNKHFIAEWGKDWIKYVSYGADGEVLDIQPFMPDETFLSPMDMEFGPEGAFYLLEYGLGYATPHTKNSGIYRITSSDAVVSISLEGDTLAPGSSTTATVTVRNVSDSTLSDVQVSLTSGNDQLQIMASSGMNIGSIAAGESQSVEYEISAGADVSQGDYTLNAHVMFTHNGEEEQITTSTTITVFSGELIEKGLEAHFTLDGETPTNTVTSNDATIVGDVTIGQSGVVGNAYEFDVNQGTDSDIPPSEAVGGDAVVSEPLPLNGESATAGAWINYTDHESWARAPYQVGGSPDDVPTGGWDLEFFSTDQVIRPQLWQNGSVGIGSGGSSIAVDPGTWYFVVMVVDGGDCRLHVFDQNGELDASPQTWTGGSRTQTDAEPLNLAAGQGFDMAGRVDEVWAYSRALPESVVEQLYSQSLQGDDGDQLPPVVGNSPPTDPDDDGLYEDVNGDGKVNHDDVTALFEHFGDDAVQNNPDAYDFNGNGRLDYDDIVELSNSL